MLATDFLRSLLAKHKKDPDAFTANYCYYHVIPNMLTGGGTTAATLNVATLIAAIYFLFKHPDVTEKLRRGVERAKIGSSANNSIFKQAHEDPYLQNGNEETSRMFSIHKAGHAPRSVIKGPHSCRMAFLSGCTCMTLSLEHFLPAKSCRRVMGSHASANASFTYRLQMSS